MMFDNFFIVLFIADNSNDTKTDKHVSARVSIVNTYNPIHLCVNAMKQSHFCKYAICSNCKIKLEEDDAPLIGGRKKTRGAIRNFTQQQNNDPHGYKHTMTNMYGNTKQENTEDQCNHHYLNLHSHFEPAYFEPLYLKKQTTFSRNCGECGHAFVRM